MTQDRSARSTSVGRLSSRRRFLQQIAALAPGTLLACWAGDAGRAADEQAASELASQLEAVGDLVLPVSELGANGVRRAVGAFVEWQEAFEPVAELDHPYLSTDELRYGPADPRPGWAAQLRALDLEAQKRHDQGFASLERDARSALLRSHLPTDPPARLPHPSEATHVALALVAWYFATPAANDLCYEARIGRHGCGGLATVADEPEPLGGRIVENGS